MPLIRVEAPFLESPAGGDDLFVEPLIVGAEHDQARVGDRNRRIEPLLAATTRAVMRCRRLSAQRPDLARAAAAGTSARAGGSGARAPRRRGPARARGRRRSAARPAVCGCVEALVRRLPAAAQHRQPEHRAARSLGGRVGPDARDAGRDERRLTGQFEARSRRRPGRSRGSGRARAASPGAGRAASRVCSRSSRSNAQQLAARLGVPLGRGWCRAGCAGRASPPRPARRSPGRPCRGPRGSVSTLRAARIRNSRSPSRSPGAAAGAPRARSLVALRRRSGRSAPSSAFWPWRSMRPLRCSRRFGFHGISKWTSR